MLAHATNMKQSVKQELERRYHSLAAWLQSKLRISLLPAGAWMRKDCMRMRQRIQGICCILL